MTMKRQQMIRKLRKLRQAELRAKDPQFKLLWLQKQKELKLSVEVIKTQCFSQ
tara:strand:+ start:577 stop:735 length:159 start_codon:yes stop_codon:yes gene_type:complete